MIDIDFLPAKYHEAKRQRRTRYVRLLVIASFLMLLALGGAGQYGLRLRVQHELDLVRLQFDDAQMRTRRLAELQGQLKEAEAQAQLWTYLRHPWPRTRVLSELLTPLPPAIRLVRLQIVAERHASAAALVAAASQTDPKKATEALPPATRDLRRLREQTDSADTVVILEGVTSDDISLHSYLGRLAGVPIFARAELTSIEELEGAKANTSQFRARLVLRPGLGQPGSAPLAAAARREAVRP